MLQNDSIVGVESGRLYTYRGLNGTEITIARREGAPNKWIFQLCSCCHAIPTLEIGLDCPGTQTVSRVIVGLHFDERNQYVMKGQMLVNGRELTRENYNSFFQDCSVPYRNPDEGAAYDSLKGNGWISIMMPPDPNCKINLDEFREELCAALAAAGCRCDIHDLDARTGSLRGYVRTNRCTPEVVACIERVLKRHAECKQVTWIGRQIVIRPRPSPTGKAGVTAEVAVGALEVQGAKAFLLQELEEIPVPPEVMEALTSGIAGLPEIVPLPLVGVSLAFPLPIGALEVGASLLTDGMLRGLGGWPAEGVELAPGLSADFQLAAWRLSYSWGLGLELGLLAARGGLGVGAFGGNFLVEFSSPDPEIQELLPELCPEAFRWLAAGPVLWAGLELGPPFLRLSLRGSASCPWFKPQGRPWFSRFQGALPWA